MQIELPNGQNLNRRFMCWGYIQGSASGDDHLWKEVEESRIEQRGILGYSTVFLFIYFDSARS